VPINLLWAPDIRLYNSATEDVVAKVMGYNALIYNAGRVLYVPYVNLDISCIMDVTWFPFDKQSCNVKFGSWTFSEKQINLTLGRDKADTTEYYVRKNILIYFYFNL
jgi:nicotinic acetylcholine receptor